MFEIRRQENKLGAQCPEILGQKILDLRFQTIKKTNLTCPYRFNILKKEVQRLEMTVQSRIDFFKFGERGPVLTYLYAVTASRVKINRERSF